MIQKRYEFWSKQGKTWSDWYDYDEHDEMLEAYQSNEKFQLNTKLRNEFKVVTK